MGDRHFWGAVALLALSVGLIIGLLALPYIWL